MGKAAYGNADGNRPDYKTKADPAMCRVGFIIGRMRHCAPARKGGKAGEQTARKKVRGITANLNFLVGHQGLEPRTN